MRLLIVEDEVDLRLAVKMALVEDGYVIDVAENGEEGLYKALNWAYDAILLDIMMPVMDGWTMLEKLRLEKQTPVLMLTARGEIDDRVKGLDLGSDDFLVKPFDMAELSARIRALIRRSAGHSSSILTAGDLVINTALKMVQVNGKCIKLTANEYALIQYMVMHCDRVVTRTELYEHLFDENDDSFSNVLDVHMCNVRKKLSNSYIKTRRGQGYLLES